MARKTMTREQLLAAWAEMEKEERSKKGEKLAPKEPTPIGTLLREEKCKNCKAAFYRSFPATDNFPSSAKFCGCRMKQSLVDPNGHCECFT